MSGFRIFIILLMLTGWFAGSNRCMVAAAVAPEMDVCCGDESSEQSPSDCRECTILETGFCPAQIQPLALPVRVAKEDSWMTRLLAAAVDPTALRDRFFNDASPPPPDLWLFVARAAVPVRGPSLS